MKKFIACLVIMFFTVSMAFAQSGAKKALMLGSFIAKGEFKEQAFDSTERYTSVWVKRGGRWQLIAEQGTLVPRQ